MRVSTTRSEASQCVDDVARRQFAERDVILHFGVVTGAIRQAISQAKTAVFKLFQNFLLQHYCFIRL
ncbi:hypothetical protein QNH14_02500 [Apirhabdus apintestini]|nr:hypothetical protein QNH14_02500 [Enterobacteriaceae bacterium CA-0114]